MNRKYITFRTILFIICGLILLWLLINYVYQSIHRNYWEDQNQAISKAYEATTLVSANKVEPFTLEQSYMIVFGKDAEGKNLIVWVGEEEIHSEYTSDGINKKQIKEIMLDKDPSVDIKRMTPGKYKEEWAWEVSYSSNIGGSEVRSYYDYYRFSDGKLLETYKMSIPR